MTKGSTVPPGDVTALLGEWSRGSRTALTELLPVVYAELRRVAARQLRNERADHTLQPTALVHAVGDHSRGASGGLFDIARPIAVPDELRL